SVRGQSAPEHYPRSLHDALPIWPAWRAARRRGAVRRQEHGAPRGHPDGARRVGFAHGPPFLEIEGKYVLKIVVATAKPEATKHWHQVLQAALPQAQVTAWYPGDPATGARYAVVWAPPDEL